MFVQVLEVARENQLSRFGRVSLDGTKIHANASRHSALSYGHAERFEVQELLALAEQADGRNLPAGRLRGQARRAAAAKAAARRPPVGASPVASPPRRPCPSLAPRTRSTSRKKTEKTSVFTKISPFFVLKGR